MQNLERDFDRLADRHVSRVDLRNLYAENRLGRVDEGHHRRLCSNASAFAQRQVRHVAPAEFAISHRRAVDPEAVDGNAVGRRLFRVMRV
jgi:hypothetical protein